MWHSLAMTLLLAMMLPMPAGAQPVIVKGRPVGAAILEQMCATSGDAMALACDAFLRGMMEGLVFGQLNDSGEAGFCLPAEGIDADELRGAFLDYLDGDPDRHDEEAGQVLLEALDARYPCEHEDVPDDITPDAVV